MYPIISIYGIKIYTFSLFFSLAMLSCFFIYNFSCKYDKFYKYTLYKSVIYTSLGTIMLGKLFYFVAQLRDRDISWIDRFSGFVFYGGFCGMFLGLCFFSKKEKISFLNYLDVYLTLLPLGQALGRIGCYFNGCCYGIEYSGILSIVYSVSGKEINVFPTWFVESVFCLCLFCSFFINSKQLYSGTYSALYMIGYSLFRFVLEFYRGDDVRGIWYGISMSQYISVIIFILGMCILFRSVKYKQMNYMINYKEKLK